MALVLQDRVKENSTSSGTGTVTLAGAYTGFRTFASCVPDGSVVYYCIHNLAPGYQSEWEVGYGTYSSNTLTRTSVYSSSNANALVPFTSGSGGLEVFITYPSEQAVFQETDGSLKIISGVIEVSEDGTEGTTLPGTAYQAFSTMNSYMQTNMQNLSSGTQASSDFVATADNGSDTTLFIDMGMASSGYNYPQYSAQNPNSGYLISTGTDLQLVAGKYGANTSGNASDTDIVMFAGSLLNTAERARLKGLTGNFILSNTPNPTDNGQKLQVVGTSDFSGNATFQTYAFSGADITTAPNSTALATKGYVDSVASTGIIIHTAVRVESPTALNATYNQPGSDGVNATLTNAGTNAAIQIDGVSLNVNDRVLVYTQANATHNGVYYVSTQGASDSPGPGAKWVLTRTTDTNTYGAANPNKLGEGSYFFVQQGNTGAGESYVCSTVGTITFGTTNINFSQFSAAPAYTGGTNINVSGQTISLTGIVAASNGGTGNNSYASGDTLYATGSTTLSKLTIGSTGQTMIVSGGLPIWGALDMAGSGVSGVLPESHGGTNNSTYVTGNILYASATNTLDKLGPNTTTTKKFLNQTGTGTAGQAPSWDQPAASDITGLAASATTDTTNADNITSGTLANARTTASSSNGANTIVARDASGNFSANTITANVSGNISGSAASLTNAQNFQISGGATAANVSFNGTAAVNLNVTAMNASVINTGTIGNAYTTAASANGASTIVARDASGNFTANNVTATNIIAAGDYITSLNASIINTGTLANARTTGSSANGANTLVLRDASGDFTSHNITASFFSGDGSALTSLNGSAISSGTVANARTTAASSNGASTIIARDANGSFTANVGTFTTITGDGSGVTAINASNISSGTLANARTTAASSNGASTIIARDANGSFTANVATLTTVTGDGSGVTAINASNISSGTLANARTTAASSNGASTIIARDANGSFTANVATLTTVTGDGSGLTALNGTAISTGTVANARTTAASANGASTIVARDASGNFSANTITASLTGTASTATAVANALTAGTGISYSSGTTYNGSAAITISIPQAVGTTSNVQFGSFGVGTAASGTTGEIRATNNVTAYYSDERLKTRLGIIDNALAKLKSLEGFYYEANETAQALGYEVKKEVGVSAQQVQAVMPEVVAPAPIDEKYLTVRYERLVPLLIEAIKELESQVAELKGR